MTSSPRAFAVEIFREHLEEASFLYEQRLKLLEESRIPWKTIGDFEERFEAHIDGLVVGGALALNVCGNRAAEGDSGELHSAVRVFCRQREKELLWNVLEQLDPTEMEKVVAVTDALKYECPEDWFDNLVSFADRQPKLSPILGSVAGWRRFGQPRALLKWLGELPGSHVRQVIWALGRIRDRGSAGPIGEFLRFNENSTRAAAALALMRMGDLRVVDYCLQEARSGSWPLIWLGLGAGRSAGDILLRAAAQKADEECILALGLLGNISAIPSLIAKFDDPKSANAAALALYMLTGARLSEEVFVPDEIDEAELFDEEREQFEQGRVPTRLNGKPFGYTLSRISQDAQQWQKWWSENQSRFEPQLRYRTGEPYSPRVLLQNLESAESPYRLRRFACEEFVIRYAADVPLEVDMTVADQKNALAALARWTEANDNRFKEGSWYYSGARSRD
jgi:uncharacterized protein (TIGR02270 family)